MEENNSWGTGVPNVMPQKNSITAPFVALLVVSLAFVAAFFLPILSMSAAYRETFGGLVDSLGQSTMGYSVTNISFLTMIRAIFDSSSIVGMTSEMIIVLVILCLLALFALFTLLFAVLKKPIATIVFDVLAILVFAIMLLGIGESNLVGRGYDYGIAFYVYMISFVAIIACSIWLAVAKSSAKKAAYNSANVYNNYEANTYETKNASAGNGDAYQNTEYTQDNIQDNNQNNENNQ